MSRTIVLEECGSAIVFRHDGTVEWHIPEGRFRNQKDDPRGLGVIALSIVMLCENDPEWMLKSIAQAQPYVKAMIDKRINMN